MRNVTDAMKQHLAGEVLTLATLWRIERQDKTEFFYTDHVTKIEYLGDTYIPGPSLLTSPLVSSRSLQTDNMEILSIFVPGEISEAEIEAGLYDDARIDVLQVNYEDLSMGAIIRLRNGRLGNIEIRDNGFTAEVRGITQRLDQEIVDLYSEKCTAILGDARCGVDLDDPDFYEDSDVYAVTESNRRTFQAALATASDDPDAFRYGFVTWTSGANNGFTREIDSYDPDTMELRLLLPMPYEIEVGDTFRATMGCDKDVATCQARFNNVLNFRGFPHIPDGRRIQPRLVDKGGLPWNR